jgi:hypothetical protein
MRDSNAVNAHYIHSYRNIDGYYAMGESAEERLAPKALGS